jgi:hypothetical protein
VKEIGEFLSYPRRPQELEETEGTKLDEVGELELLAVVTQRLS